MKSGIKVLIAIATILICLIYKDEISTFIIQNLIYKDASNDISYNSYYKENNYAYVQITDDFKAKNKQDILNIFYTGLNSGMEEFSFFCDESYSNCINEVELLSDDVNLLSTFNDFVHSYNAFSKISINITDYGKVTIYIEHVYNNDQINYINSFINTFIQNNIADSMSNTEKIRIFHDYIINNTKYDTQAINDNNSISYNAYGLLVNKKAICGGYSDIMAIYLTTLGIPNFKISTNEHIWNLVYIDGNWLHLDLTWDDPVASDGKDYLFYKFFLINTDKLLSLDTTQHNFNRNIYLEAK